MGYVLEAYNGRIAQKAAGGFRKHGRKSRFILVYGLTAEGRRYLFDITSVE